MGLYSLGLPAPAPWSCGKSLKSNQNGGGMMTVKARLDGGTSEGPGDDGEARLLSL